MLSNIILRTVLLKECVVSGSIFSKTVTLPSKADVVMDERKFPEGTKLEALPN